MADVLYTAGVEICAENQDRMEIDDTPVFRLTYLRLRGGQALCKDSPDRTTFVKAKAHNAWGHEIVSVSHQIFFERIH